MFLSFFVCFLELFVVCGVFTATCQEWVMMKFEEISLEAIPAVLVRYGQGHPMFLSTHNMSRLQIDLYSFSKKSPPDQFI